MVAVEAVRVGEMVAEDTAAEREVAGKVVVKAEAVRVVAM